MSGPLTSRDPGEGLCEQSGLQSPYQGLWGHKKGFSFASHSLAVLLSFYLCIPLFLSLFLYVVLKTSLFFREGGYCFFLSHFPLIFYLCAFGQIMGLCLFICK